MSVNRKATLPPDDNFLQSFISRRKTTQIMATKFRPRVENELNLFNYPEGTIFSQPGKEGLPEEKLLIKNHSPFLNPDLLPHGKRRKHAQKKASTVTVDTQLPLEIMPQQTIEEAPTTRRLSRIERINRRMYPKCAITDDEDIEFDSELSFLQKLQIKNERNEQRN